MLPPPVLPPPIVVSDSTSQIVTFQALVTLPDLTPQEEANVAVLAQIMAKQTGDYTPGKVNFIVSGSGDNLRAVLMPDHLRFSFSVPQVDEALGLSLLSSLLKNPMIDDDTVSAAKKVLLAQTRVPWQLVLAPTVGDISMVRAQDVKQIYDRLVRPELVTVAIGGDLDPMDVSKAYAKRMSDWVPARLGRPRPDYRKPSVVADKPTRYSIVSLAGQTFVAKDAAISAKILAAFALGCGKGAAVYRVWREQQGWSYLQQCWVEGTPGGFRLDAWFAQEGSEGLDVRAKAAQAALDTDVDAWTEADRTRALSMAEAVLVRGLNINPFTFQPNGPVGNSLQDRTFLNAYWKMKTGQIWDPRGICEDLQKVDLASLKAEAKAFVDGSKPRLFPGS